MDRTENRKQLFWVKQNITHLLWSVLLLVILCGVYFGLLKLVSEILMLSKDFGAEETVLSQFIFKYYYIYPYFYYLSKLSFIVYLIHVAIKGIEKGLFKKIVITNIVITALIACVTLIGVYIPIIKLGSVI